MSKLVCTAAFAGALLLPSTAGATAIAMSSLESNSVTVTFSHDIEGSNTGELFSTASAAFGPTGVSTSDNNPLPGVADAPEATDGPMRADSFFMVEPGDIMFSSEASGSVSAPGDFGTAIGEVTGSFEFFNPTDGLEIVIMIELTRMIDLATDLVGELASGATSLSLGLVNDIGTFMSVMSLSDPDCDPNEAFSVVDGADFSDTCTTTATYTFSGLPAGDYTLTFGSNSSVDLVAVPVPAAFGLFGLGLAALGFRNKLRRR